MVDFRPPAFLSPPYTPSSLSFTMPPVSPALSAFSSRGGSDWGGEGVVEGDPTSDSATGGEGRDRRRAPCSSAKQGQGQGQGPRGLRTAGSGEAKVKARAVGMPGGGDAEAADRVPTTPALLSSLSSPRSGSGGGREASSSSLVREGSWRLEDQDGDGDLGATSSSSMMP